MAVIFIIDDNPEVLSVTLKMFIRKGYEAVGASNGVDAIQMVSHIKPDLIVTDVVMPQMDGFKLLKVLKNNPATSTIPILVISGHGQMEKSFEVLGIKGFMTKPFSTQKLLLKVQEILNPDVSGDSP